MTKQPLTSMSDLTGVADVLQNQRQPAYILEIQASITMKTLHAELWRTLPHTLAAQCMYEVKA